MKNKFLFLSATALLSTGALIANADTAADSLTANVQAEITIMEPAKISASTLSFPYITTGGGRNVVIDPDGTVNSTSDAQFISSNPNDEVESLVLTLSGGDVGVIYEAKLTQGNFNLENYKNYGLLEMPESITLTDNSANNSGDCGTVEDFVAGTPRFATDDNGATIMEFPYGATFKMKEGFHPKNGYATCWGTETVTYIPYDY